MLTQPPGHFSQLTAFQTLPTFKRKENHQSSSISSSGALPLPCPGSFPLPKFNQGFPGAPFPQEHWVGGLCSVSPLLAAAFVPRCPHHGEVPAEAQSRGGAAPSPLPQLLFGVKATRAATNRSVPTKAAPCSSPKEKPQPHPSAPELWELLEPFPGG